MPLIETDCRERIGVLCVDDNCDVAEAIRIKLTGEGVFRWLGWLATAKDLLKVAEEVCPAIVLLDIDMPGPDPFAACTVLLDRCPSARVVFFSGHVHREYIGRALESGAWGYASKNDGEDELIEVIQRVAGGEFAFSSEVRSLYHG